MDGPIERRLRDVAGDGTCLGDDVAEALAELAAARAEIARLRTELGIAERSMPKVTAREPSPEVRAQIEAWHESLDAVSGPNLNAVPIKIPDWPGLVAERDELRVLLKAQQQITQHLHEVRRAAEAELEAARARVAELEAFIDEHAPSAYAVYQRERLDEEWARGLADGRGRHVPVRRAWPELADLLDTLIDN